MLYAISREVVGSDDFSRIKSINAKDHILTFFLNDGTEIAREYKLKSRSESWNPEMKKAVSDRMAKRRTSR